MADIRRGRWLIRKPYKQARSPYWSLNIRDTRTGKVHRLSTKKTRKRWAEESIEEFLNELEAREDGLRRSRVPLFEDAYAEFLDTKSVRPITLSDYKKDQKGVYNKFLGGKVVLDIEFADVQTFLTAYKDRASRTRQKHISALRGFFTWAENMKYIEKNPCGKIKIQKGERKEPEIPDFAEAKRMVIACRDPVEVMTRGDRRRPGGWKQIVTPPEKLYVAVVIAFYTGLRYSNIKGLRWKHVNLGQRKITLPASEMKGKQKLELPIHPVLSTLLKQRLTDQNWVNSEALVVGEKVSALSKSLQRALKRSGLRRITWHGFRHTFSSWLYSRCPYACVKKLLGHSPGSDVTALYIHPSWQEKVDAINQLPDLLSAEPGSVAV
jgi:integrase